MNSFDIQLASCEHILAPKFGACVAYKVKGKTISLQPVTLAKLRR